MDEFLRELTILSVGKSSEDELLVLTQTVTFIKIILYLFYYI